MARFYRLAGIGAWLVSAGMIAAFAGYVFIVTWPNGEGMDRTEAIVAWVAGGCVAAALIAVHVVYARILSAMASGQKYTIESSWPVGAGK